MTKPSFFSIYRHGFVRIAACTPKLWLADPQANLNETLRVARLCDTNGVGLVLFPELGLSAYSADDLFFQDALLDEIQACIRTLLVFTENIFPVLVIGVPLRAEGKLFNCALVVHRGRLLGVVPKTYIPNYREFYEKRQFSAAREAVRRNVRIADCTVPFGSDLIFEANDYDGFLFHVEICEDLWAPLSPSSFAALAGATVLLNLSASNITIGKSDTRRSLCLAQSSRCSAAYVYSASGPGESTTDLAWDGHALIAENGHMLAETDRFPKETNLISADVDLEMLRQERTHLSTFRDCAGDHRDQTETMRVINFDFQPDRNVFLIRTVQRFPFVPNIRMDRDKLCYDAYNIQVHGLKQRLQASGINRAIIGISGGLDSSQALIVTARCFDDLGLPRKNILAYTLPGYGTGDRTYINAWKLMKALGVNAAEIDIRPSCNQMFADLNHPFSTGEPVYDITFENVQAGHRTSLLFRLANQHNGLVIGTGDLSELALGWCTYGVGDHMAHYNVNASVPKTLIQHLIRWVIDIGEFGDEVSDVLRSILDTEISPELIPTDDGVALQSSQEIIGPYELQDFNLFYVTRYGFRPSKIAFLAYNAWHDAESGAWPEDIPSNSRTSYDLPMIVKWLKVFLYRFFQTSQFKRTAMPNGPKVASGGALSPRSDWRAPSDSSATVWLAELKVNVPKNDT